MLRLHVHCRSDTQPGSTTPNQAVPGYVADVKILNFVQSAIPEQLSVLFPSILYTAFTFIPQALRQTFEQHFKAYWLHDALTV